ncbi:vacuolar carboxypeptidase Cps1 [Lecanosticta acicola]|uniref:Vacuolar carboxypeptidase Cps1 n=1 Tax=Lecanosticta acicola TaxID=111012 RepID=A0AAI8Z630_9PEZI|nr:vacuolar carboxypeptidase Cps1 [Lecanosticta acicola]
MAIARWRPFATSLPLIAKPPTLERRAETASQTCEYIGPNQLLISRPAFIAILTILTTITLLSLLSLATILYRQHLHQRKILAWGRRSRYGARISIMRKEIDDSFTRQYKGCWVGEVVENPEMGSWSPVEMATERRVWEMESAGPAKNKNKMVEVPAVPAVPGRAAGRRSKVGSLFFDPGSGLWMPKRNDSTDHGGYNNNNNDDKQHHNNINMEKRQTGAFDLESESGLEDSRADMPPPRGLQRHIPWRRCLLLFSVVCGMITLGLYKPFPILPDSLLQCSNAVVPPMADEESNWCPLPAPLLPSNDGLQDSIGLFAGEKALQKQIERLSAAVNVPTVSYDDNGDVGEDPRWQVFGELHAVLEHLFPLVLVRRTKVNRHGLLYHLEGSDSSLQPMLFMAHRDVVPEIDAARWTHPPFEAYWDGGFLWGRGSADCKSNLIGILTAVEALLKQSFQPRRSVLLAFGFDEETGGQRGARSIAAELQRLWGNNSLAMIVDEGGMGVSTLGDVAYVLPATAEKGFLDIVLTLDTDGGHSSRPPKHTAIGIMSEVILALENHPFEPWLGERNPASPVRNVLECEAEHSPSHVEPWLRRGLASGRDIGSEMAEARGDAIRWQIQTSQAVDVIHGGDKDNQLPNRVQVTVNYRIAPQDNNVEALYDRVATQVAAVAHRYNISVSGLGFDEEQTTTTAAAGILRLQSKDLLIPSPITPTTQASDAWRVFSGTLRQVFETTDTLSGVRTVVPVGSIATGNSDTAHYWALTRNIYRFTPAREGSRLRVHDIDERMQMSAHMEGIRVYYELIRNMQ